MKRFLACFMSVVLAIGLLPTAAFGTITSASLPLAPQGNDSSSESAGLQLNEKPYSITNYGSGTQFSILPSYLDEGGVAIAFEGTAAPRFILADANRSVFVRIKVRGTKTLITTSNDEVLCEMDWPENEPALVWGDDAHTAGTVRFSAEVIEKAAEVGEFAVSDVRRVWVQGNAGNTTTTVNRVVMTGMDPLPEVSGGNYGAKTMRRLYTRPVTLRTSPNSQPYDYRTVNIAVDNPIYGGADIAVRYTTPTDSQVRLQFCFVKPGNKWEGWSTMAEADGAHTVAASDGSDEKVTFFGHEEIERFWSENGGKDGDAREYMYICVKSQDGNTPADTDICKIVEVVALGGDDRIDSQAGKTEVTGKTAWEIAQAMQAGYNMAGHLESNYVPETKPKDGGWGQSDLALEAHWARGTYITRENIRALKKKGFNAIRLPVTWFQHIYPEGDPTGDPLDHVDDMTPTQRYHIDRAWLDRVHEVVDWCIAEDLYVIVNMHHEDWIDRQDLGTAYADTDLPVKFEAVWTQIAEELSGYDQRLVFEDMNEPHMWYYERNADGSFKLDSKGKKVVNWGFATEGSVTTVNRLNADFVKLMRAMPSESGHADRLLMMTHDTGGGEIATTGFVMPDDNKNLLAHSLHCYSPHEWTHYFANGNHQGETGELNAYSESYRASVEAKWESYRLNYISQGEPIILGEFGCYYLGESAERKQDRLDWMTQYATHAKELGMPMFYWRMDRTKEDENGKEYVEWSAFDEETHDFSELSRDMLQTWLDIVNDSSIPWGSGAAAVEGEHADIAGGKQLGTWPATIKGNHNGTKDWRVTFDGFTWDDISGNEIAVKYTGSTPRIGMLKDWDGDWWGVAPDTVDYQQGIAYFTSSTIETRWNAIVAANAKRDVTDKEYRQSLIGAPASDINRLLICTGTSGSSTPLDDAMNTTIESVSIVHQHQWGAWVAGTPDSSGEAVQTRVCTLNSEHVQTRVSHEWGAWETVGAVSCEEGRVQKRVCKHHPDAVQTRTVSPTGHWWDGGVVTTAAGPARDGVLTRTCALCGATKTEAIPATGRLPMSSVKVTLTVGGKTPSKNAVAYTGTAQKPSVTVQSTDGKTLESGTDYNVAYLRGGKTTKDFTSAGEISVKVSALDSGDYKDSKTLTFTIKPITVKKPVMALSKTSVAYTGKALKPAVTVWTDSGKKKKVPASEYTVTYAKNVNPGKATAAVKSKGNYTFAGKTLTFTVKPKGTSLSAVAASKNCFTAKWKQQSTQTSGYQLQYGLKSNHKGSKMLTVSGAKKTSAKVPKGLKSSKTYYVRVRTFKTVGGVKYCSDWSKNKSVKVK